MIFLDEPFKLADAYVLNLHTITLALFGAIESPRMTTAMQIHSHSTTANLNSNASIGRNTARYLKAVTNIAIGIAYLHMKAKPIVI